MDNIAGESTTHAREGKCLLDLSGKTWKREPGRAGRIQEDDINELQENNMIHLAWDV
jgi:hypothetical protein